MKNHVFKKLRLLTYACTSCVFLMILSSGTAWAVWCATSECSSCGSHNWSKREECKFDSQAACNNEVARVKREMSIAGAVFTCYEKGSGNTSTTSGDPMAEAILGALTGNRQQFSIGLGGWLGQAIGNSIRGNPEEDARRRAEQEAERHRAEQEAQRRAEQRRAEEEARAAEQKRIAEERERQTEATKQRLLSELIGLDASPQLALMGIDSSSNLQLMTGETPLLLNQGDPEHLIKTGDTAFDAHKQTVTHPFGTGAVSSLYFDRDSDAIPVSNETPTMLSQGSAPNFPASWGTPEQVHEMLAPSIPPVSQDASLYIGRAAKFVSQDIWDRTQPTIRKAFVAEFGSLEGAILFNQYKLPGYVLPKILAASKGDLTVEQANLLPFAAVNVLYNLETLPNKVVAKLSEGGNPLNGAISVVMDEAVDKVTGELVKEIGKVTTTWVATLYSKYKYPGGQTANSPGGHFQNIMYYETKNENTKSLREDSFITMEYLSKGKEAYKNVWASGEAP